MKIRLEADGHGVVARPTQFLDRESFSSYVAACRKGGMRYHPVRRGQVGRSESVYQVIRELSAVGFVVSVDESVQALLDGHREKMKEEASRARALHDAALERMKRIDVELAKRGLALFGYQRDGVRWLSHRDGAGLFDEMGLGKTVQALLAAAEGAPMLVVCPAAVKGVWYSETRRWRSDIGWPRVLRGRHSFRWPFPGEMLITNYDILPRIRGEAELKGKRPDWSKLELEGATRPKPGTVVIADECHLLKGNQTLRHRRFKVLAHQARAEQGRVWGLTGTPMLNRQMELWNVLDAIGIASEVFGTKRHFYRLTNAYCGSYGMQFGSTRPEVPKLLQRCTLLRRRDDVLQDLPTKMHRSVVVEGLDDAVRRLMDEFLERLRKAGVDITEASLADLQAVLKQPVIFEMMSKIRAALATAKIPATVESVEPFEDAGEPVVVFSAHRAPVLALGSRPGWGAITGSTPAAERTRLVEEFQAGRLAGLAGTVKAAGVGLTLTKAHQAIFVDREWTPALNTQAEDRICRIGQTRGVIITNLTADHPIDERLEELLTEKTENIDETVNASARTTVEEQFADEIAGLSVTVEDTVAAPATEVPLPNLRALVDRARSSGLAQPRIRTQGLELYVTGRMSRYPGSLYVVNGRKRGSGAFWGWIDQQGVWHKRNNPPQPIEARLVGYNEDVERLINDCVAYAKRTGACSFCGSELTDARSVQVGYGPICAQRYGLSWGDASLIGTTKVQWA